MGAKVKRHFTLKITDSDFVKIVRTDTTQTTEGILMAKQALFKIHGLYGRKEMVSNLNLHIIINFVLFYLSSGWMRRHL